MLINVTEFVRPNGHQIQREIPIPDRLDLEDKYNILTASGCRITMEHTPSATFIVIEDNAIDADFITEIVPSGTNILMGFISVLEQYNASNHASWRMEQEQIMYDEPPF